MSTGGNKDTLLTRLSKRGQLAGKKTGSGSVAATTTEKLSERNGIFASLSLLLHGDGERSGEERKATAREAPARPRPPGESLLQKARTQARG
jgi:hypothetical protein